MRSALVSGLGPNGMLAALTLRSAGFAVTAIEQRCSYARTIHLNLRRSYLDDVRALDEALHEKLCAIASPIEAFQYRDLRSGVGLDQSGPSQRSAGSPRTTVAERLAADPTMHVRLDELERVFASHLAGLRGIAMQTGVRLDAGALGPDAVRCERVDRVEPTGADLHLPMPDLVVIAEGGKSSTARRLGHHMLKLSAPKFYLSVHVDYALGPVTRRLDADVDVAGRRVPVSFWATGHREKSRGTWLVLEVPEGVHAHASSRTIDRDYYLRWARELLGLSVAPEPSPASFSGTFRFEQQLLLAPVSAPNVVFFGDCAGMGHHALGTGLEVGACDAAALRELAAASVLRDGLWRYRQQVVDARVALLAFGLKEYYPGLRFDAEPFVRHAVALANEGGGADVRVQLESWLRGGAVEGLTGRVRQT